MLTELCRECRNYFLRNRENDIHTGTFEINGGDIEPLSFLTNGQYYRIVGSVFNDGVHKYGDPFDEALTDERFDGAVWAMYVPPAFVALAEEVEKWQADHAEALAGPYQSESFGGYSYSKGASANGGAYTWADQFAGQLKNWRRVNIL